MSKSKRYRYREHMAKSIYHIDLAIDHLSVLEPDFSGQHPELGEALQLAIVGLTEVDTLLRRFSEKVYGPAPENIEDWINPNR